MGALFSLLSQEVTITVNAHVLDPLMYPKLTVEVQKGVVINATSIYLYLYYWNNSTGFPTAARGKTQREVL